MTIHMVEQGSPEWHALRCGKVTASRIPDLGFAWGRTQSAPNPINPC